MLEEEDLGTVTAKMTGFILAGKLVSFIMLAAAFMLVTRILGPSTYGIYTAAIASIGFFSAFGTLGIDTSAMKFMSSYRYMHKKKEMGMLVADSLAIAVALGAVLACITALSGTWLASLLMHNADYAYILEIASMSVFGAILFNIFLAIVVGYGKGRQATIAIITMTSMQAGIAIALAVLGFGALAPLLGLIFGQFGGFAVAIIAISKHIKFARPSLKRIRKLFGFSLPIGMSNLLNNTYSSLVIMVLGIASTPLVLGNIGVASLISYFVGLITGSVGMAVIPMFTRKVSERKSGIGGTYSTTVYLSIVLVAPMLLLIMLFSRQAAALAFGGAYKLAPLYITIFAAGTFLGLINMYSGQLLVTTERVKKLFMYTLAEFIICMSLMPFLVFWLKGTGAALMLYLVPQAVWDILFFAKIAGQFHIKVPKRIIGVAFANMGVAIAVAPLFLLSNAIVQIALGIAIAALAYPAFLALMKGVGIDELGMIRRITKGMPVAGKAINALCNYSEYFMKGQKGQ